MTPIVYEDEELQAFWMDGSSDFLLIAFGDLVSPANGQTFSVQGPASKLGIACLGIMAKRPNWYPRENLKSLADAVSALTARYEDRVTYGASMGGHGAIKAGRLFRARTTVALCPQWSINPRDQTTVPLGWDEYFTAEIMDDMAIQADDLSGSVVILSDPGEPRDAFHCRQIAALSRDVTSVSVYFCDHNVTPVLSGTANFHQILALSRTGQHQTLARFVSSVRRPHFFRRKALVERGLARKAKLTTRVVLKRMKDDALIREVVRDLPSALRDRMIQAMSPSEQFDYTVFLINEEAATTTGKFRRSLALTNDGAVEFELFTPFGTKVFYDVEGARLAHVPEGHVPSRYRPISLFLHNQKLEIFVEGRFCRVSLPEKHGSFSPEERYFTMQEIEGRRVTLQRDGLFLSADPRGTISCDRVHAADWEYFRIHVTASSRKLSALSINQTGDTPMSSSNFGGDHSAAPTADAASRKLTDTRARQANTITICAIAKNESRYIVEWLAYHLALGADHILVYSNESDDDQAAKLDTIAQRDPRVTWRNWTSQPGTSPQVSAYNDALKRVTTAWICFIDIDEFLVPLEAETLAEWLATVPDDVSSVHVNWRGFGSSGVQSSAYDLVTRTFSMAAPVGWGNHHHFKTIARTHLATEAMIHNVVTSSGRRTLSDFSQFETINNGISDRIVYHRIQINHYQCKTFEEFSARMRRGDANVAEGPGKLRDGSAERFQQLDLNEEENLSIRRFDRRVDEELRRLKSMLVFDE